MKFAGFSTTKRLVGGALCAAALGAAACSDGPGSPTSPGASPGSSTATSFPRSGELHVTKECSSYAARAGDFCTITSSNIDAIEVGSRVVYASAAGASSLDTDVTLVVNRGNTASGHCYLDFATGVGLCTFSGGTGKFTHFSARAAVSYRGGPDWAWDGAYSFSPRD